VVYGALVALLEPYKPPRTPLVNGLFAAAGLILVFAPGMRWSRPAIVKWAPIFNHVVSENGDAVGDEQLGMTLPQRPCR
jgi:hypothetical protein